jgi:hypothetical protein
METIMSVYPRHKAVVDRFVARGEVSGIGPFADLGNIAIFGTRAAAEECVKEVIREWNDKMLEHHRPPQPTKRRNGMALLILIAVLSTCWTALDRERQAL